MTKEDVKKYKSIDLSKWEAIPENWYLIDALTYHLEVLTGDVNTSFARDIAHFPGERLLPVTAKTVCRSKGAKPKGSGYYEWLFFARFCPFTGRPLYREIPDYGKSLPLFDGNEYI